MSINCVTYTVHYYIVSCSQTTTFLVWGRQKSLGLHQSAAINNHPDCRGKNLNTSVPDPTFPAPTQKKSGLATRD